jgi:predicted adenylyl cyclase CyaB
MPSNIEIKARVTDLARKRELAERLTQTTPAVLKQHDTFFLCSHGRLKLRELSATEGELIFYHRTDAAGPKESNYSIYRTSSPESLRALLTAAYGAGKVVIKTRLLYLVGKTRIHLDSVVGLGSFLELEVVLGEDDSVEAGRREAEKFMSALEIDQADLVECAYADLLEA